MTCLHTNYNINFKILYIIRRILILFLYIYVLMKNIWQIEYNPYVRLSLNDNKVVKTFEFYLVVVRGIIFHLIIFQAIIY